MKPASRTVRCTLLLLLAACSSTPERPPAAPGNGAREAAPTREREAPEPEPLPDEPLARAFVVAGRALKAGRLAAAESAALEAVRVAPGDPRVWNLAAVVAFERKDLATCEARLERALALAPDSREAILNRGLVRFAKKDYRAAAEDFRRVLSYPVHPGAILDVELARREYEERARSGEIDVPFQTAINRGLLPVDREGMYAKWYGRLAAVMARGPAFRRSYRSETESYRVVTDASEAVAEAIAADLELALVEYRRLFPPPDGWTAEPRFSVTVFAGREQYTRYLGEILGDVATAHLSGGAYQPLARELYLHLGPDYSATLVVLYHEGFHQYLDTFMPDLPPWVNEGLADYFGGSRPGAGRLVPGGVQPARIRALRDALAGRAEPDITPVLTATPAGFLAFDVRDGRRRKQRVARNYALAWAFCHFLVEGDGGRHLALLRAYLDDLARGVSHGSAFSDRIAPALADGLDRAWILHARRLLGSAP